MNEAVGQLRLDGRRVIVTGGGRGLGRAYTRRLADRGARVAIVDVNGEAAEGTAQELRAAGHDAIAIAADIGRRAEAHAAVSRAADALGGLDGLVNNAGMLRDDFLADITEADWALIRDSQLGGTLWCAQAAIGLMGEGSAIVNTTSGAQNGSQGRSAYSAAKAGIAAFTYSWAIELAPRRIRVNAVQPVAGTLMPGAKFDRFGRPSDTVGAGNPPPEYVAPLVCFLLSEAASWISGQVVALAGGVLGLVNHHDVAKRAVRREGWTEETIRDQFELGFRDRFGPIGGLQTPYPWYGGVNLGAKRRNRYERSMQFSDFDTRHYRTVSVQEGYGGWASTYEESVLDAMDLRLLERLQSISWSEVHDAADFACGTGRIGVWLARHGVTAVDGIDITTAMLEGARAKGVYRQLCLGDILATPFRSEAYDFVAAVLVDEHLRDVQQLYEEAARITRPKGHLVLVGYHPFFLMSGIPTHFDSPSGEPLAIRCYVHLFSDHVQAAIAAGWTLRELHEGLVDEEWLLRKPKWRQYRHRPVSFAMVWQMQR